MRQLDDPPIYFQVVVSFTSIRYNTLIALNKSNIIRKTNKWQLRSQQLVSRYLPTLIIQKAAGIHRILYFYRNHFYYQVELYQLFVHLLKQTKTKHPLI